MTRALGFTDGTNALTVLSVLAESPARVYTPTELHEATGLPRRAVANSLARLDEHGLVRHKGDYWTIAEDDRLGSFAAMKHSMDAAANRPDRYAEDDDWATDLPDLDTDKPTGHQ